MPFTKGHKKIGGRKPGSINKITADIMHALAAQNCDPILIMAELAMAKDGSPELRFRCAAELASFVYAKRRAIEITPGKIDPTGAELGSLTDFIIEYRRLSAAPVKK